jgi:dihydroxyacetone kinase-like protein
MMAAAKAVDTGAGVLLIAKNDSSDLMHFEMAAEMCELPNATVLVNDDLAVENSSYTTGRRGCASLIWCSLDAEMMKHSDTPAHTPAFRWGR